MTTLTRLALVPFAALALALGGCSAEENPAAPGGTAAVAPADQAVALGEHTVKCGCVVGAVGKCGNYIEVDGEFVEIANGKELGLGGMEWCGQGERTARAAGVLEDGRFVATTLEVQG